MSEQQVYRLDAYLAEHGEVTMTNAGVSMRPLIRQGRDLFTLVKKEADVRCQKYDVALYRRSSGQYVMHRVVEVREKDYVLLGDNCLYKEYGIRDEDIVGVMNGFVRKGKAYTVEDKGYRRYARFWYAIYPFRFVLMQAMRAMRAVGRRLFRRHPTGDRSSSRHTEN